MELEAQRDKHDRISIYFYTPHTITALCLGSLAVIYLAWTYNDSISTASNVKMGLVAAIAVFIAYAFIQFPNGPFIRPHPAFWRVTQGCAILYLLFLVFIAFQSKDDVRQWLRHLYPSLGTKPEYRSYGEGCDKFETFKSTLFDEFVLAHLLGWWGKTVLLRDWWLCIVLSLLFEAWEFTFMHYLPNFIECWWDHWIVDVAVCNMVGMWIGMKTCEYFKMKAYNWPGITEISDTTGKIKRAIGQFTPFEWDVFEWEVFASWRRLVQVLFLLAIISAIELNAFFLKFLLWIPPTNPLNSYRLIMWFLFGLPGVAEYYRYMHSPERDLRFGTSAWLVIAMTTMETFLTFKFGRGEFTEPFPRPVVLAWSLVALALTTTCLVLYRRERAAAAAARAARPARRRLP
eukprot:tig00000144_g9020.t1